MMKAPKLNAAVAEICQQMEAFEASEIRANVPAGGRREGGQFERLVGTLWSQFCELCLAAGARKVMRDLDGTTVPCVQVEARQFIAPGRGNSRTGWLANTFQTECLIEKYPGRNQAIERYAPMSGNFAGSRYPDMYSGLTTEFDDTLVLIEDGILREKILLEYKTAKSSRGRQIDGNAYERLSFQMMQYLEAATRFTRCSLVVFANGAFAKYRNKYHVNFHVQADRLKNFAWFNMEHACTAPEFEKFLTELLGWLFEGHPRSAWGAR